MTRREPPKRTPSSGGEAGQGGRAATSPAGSFLQRLAARLRRRFPPIDPSLPLGRRGEAAAERLLRGKGYRIVARGARDGIGELDLVALDRRTVVFVEVKTRSSDRYGHPADHVDAAKQRQLTRAALSYLKSHRLLEQRARFDVVAIWWPSGAPEPERAEHYPNAFEPVGRWQMFS